MPSIGQTLRDARIRARIDMSEVEASTKIRAKYLRAIENEEWGLLPGPVYVKSFLRTYGDFLGLDSRMLVEEYKRSYEELPEHELHPIASSLRGERHVPGLPLRRERGARPLPPRRGHDREPGARPRLVPPSWLAVVGVLVAVVVVLFIIGNNSANKAKNTSPAGLHAGIHHHRSSKHKAKTTPPKPPKPRTVTLQLIPTGAVYVCLVNGAGKAVIPGVTYNPGQTIPIETAREFKLTLGNANVQMKIDGKPFTVAPAAAAIGYLIRGGGTSPLSAGQLPTCT